MDTLEELMQNTSEIEALIGYEFHDKNFLALAFIHCSYVNENREIEGHNERLEFLGDSVLGLLIAEWLYRTLPNVPEGELSSLRSRLVEASSCYRYVEHLNIDKYLLLGRGERMNSGRGRESINADLFEAVIGAIFLDGGFEAARKFLFDKLKSEFDEILTAPSQNWKALLQDYCQKKYQEPPRYHVVSAEGPDHSKTFEISVTVNDEPIGRGKGSSKKEAQQAAAEDALSTLPPL